MRAFTEIIVSSMSANVRWLIWADLILAGDVALAQDRLEVKLDPEQVQQRGFAPPATADVVQY